MRMRFCTPKVLRCEHTRGARRAKAQTICGEVFVCRSTAETWIYQRPGYSELNRCSFAFNTIMQSSGSRNCRSIAAVFAPWQHFPQCRRCASVDALGAQALMSTSCLPTPLDRLSDEGPYRSHEQPCDCRSSRHHGRLRCYDCAPFRSSAFAAQRPSNTLRTIIIVLPP